MSTRPTIHTVEPQPWDSRQQCVCPSASPPGRGAEIWGPGKRAERRKTAWACLAKAQPPAAWPVHPPAPSAHTLHMQTVRALSMLTRVQIHLLLHPHPHPLPVESGVPGTGTGGPPPTSPHTPPTPLGLRTRRIPAERVRGAPSLRGASGRARGGGRSRRRGQDARSHLVLQGRPAGGHAS